MKILNGGNIERLPLGLIEVGDRLRKVSETQIENLLLMAADTGITAPIHVRKVKSRFELIDGAHRLEATRRLGLPDIACLLVECTRNEARAMEASNNLGAARMTPLQMAVFAASWKLDYYALHPERKPGVFKGNQHTGSWSVKISSLARSIAEAWSITERRALQILAVGDQLSEEEKTLLGSAAKPVRMEHLADLSKIGDEAERRHVVDALVSGAAKSTAAARRAWAAKERGYELPAKDPVEEAFNTLVKRWESSPMAARRRFVATVFKELSPLVVDEAESRDAADVSDISKGIAAE